MNKDFFDANSIRLAKLINGKPVKIQLKAINIIKEFLNLNTEKPLPKRRSGPVIKIESENYHIDLIKLTKVKSELKDLQVLINIDLLFTWLNSKQKNLNLDKSKCASARRVYYKLYKSEMDLKNSNKIIRNKIDSVLKKHNLKINPFPLDPIILISNSN